MKTKYVYGVLAAAVCATFSGLAVEKTRRKTSVIRLKVDGQLVGELHVLNGAEFKVSGDKVDFLQSNGRTVAKGANIEFGGVSKKGITVVAEEIEVLSQDE